jgi:hypothetical protein
VARASQRPKASQPPKPPSRLGSSLGARHVGVRPGYGPTLK